MSKSTLVRRKQMQAALAPAVQQALAGLEKLDLNRPEDARRFMRALVHIGAGELLMRGHAPQTLAEACLEAIGREVETFIPGAVVSQTVKQLESGQPAYLMAPEPFPV